MKSLIIEGRYDSLVRQLSNRLLDVVKNSYSATKTKDGKFAGKQIYFKSKQDAPDIDDSSYGEIYFEEVENPTIPLDFYLYLKVQWVDGLNDFLIGGDAFNETKRDAIEFPVVEIRLEMDPADYPKVLSDVAMSLADTLRHEIEHTTQSGWNTIDSKYLPSDQAMRRKIETGQLPPWRYFTLPKEIPAMIHGMYLAAKKKRIPFRDEVNIYLNKWVSNGTMTEQDKQKIIDTWRNYLPKLAIRQEL